MNTNILWPNNLLILAFGCQTVAFNRKQEMFFPLFLRLLSGSQKLELINYLDKECLYPCIIFNFGCIKAQMAKFKYLTMSHKDEQLKIVIYCNYQEELSRYLQQDKGLMWI